MKRYVFAVLLAVQAAALLSCESGDKKDVSFSYAGIIDREYRFNEGRVIPVTIAQSIETDGDISSDGRYFYYTSNVDSGNFDIYLRAMDNIITVRLTGHPSKDTNPVISPDGRTLAFVSFRDDPEGDIYTVDIDAEKLVSRFVDQVENKNYKDEIQKLISNGAKSTGITEALDAEAVNLTSEQQGGSGVSLAIREANPVWRPDGKYLAFSRTVQGSTEIWMMKKNGKDKKQLTKGGGDYPSFSPDGRRIVYISYRESGSGEIYTVDIESGKTEKVQAEPGIKLYPCYAGGEGKIVYSLIQGDTNKNGRLDLDDRSVLQYTETGSGISYRLTKESVSSFKGRWLGAVKTRDYQGIILYTDITGENININMIPDTGIIPKKQNAKLQLDYCSTYLEEWDDAERYEMSLEAVNFFFGTAGDSSSATYVDRSLGMSASYYIRARKKESASRVLAVLKKRAGGRNPYASLQLRMAEEMFAGKKTDYAKILDTLRGQKGRSFYIPFAIEDIGDLYFSAGNIEAASRVYKEILADYADYERAMDINVKISICDDDLRSRQLSESAVKVLTSGNANQRVAVVLHLVSGFQKGDFSPASAGVYLKNVSAVKEKFREDKKVLPAIKYAAGLLYLKTGDPASASGEFRESIEIAPKNDIINHLANIMNGDIERRAARLADAEKYYSEGFANHSRRFRTENMRERLLWLVGYYEQTGLRLSASGKFMDGAKNHRKNTGLLTTMHNKRLFPEIYNEYAARAHALYVDSFIEWKGEKGIDELEAEYIKNLPNYKMDRDKAAFYGFAYIYSRKAMFIENMPAGDTDKGPETLVVQALAGSDEQIEWALFIDDTFIEPYLLKSWNYQFIDYRRSSGDEAFTDASAKFFQEHLWEKSIPILEKAVTVNDEVRNSEHEGNLNLNMANTYFLLQNYPRALKHYQLAGKYKKNFGSETEQALYHFHSGYCHWQNNDTAKAREEINRAYVIYRNMSGGRTGIYAARYLVFYRYFALFSRYEGKYGEAIKWYRAILELADGNRLEIDRARYLQEIARCYIELEDTDTATAYISQAEQLLKKYPDDTRKYYTKLKLFGIIPFFAWDLGPDSLVIGGTSIFYPLDTFSKKLLNISMLEEIALKNNDYAAAIKHLKNKIKLTGEKDTDLSNDIMIRSLNNLGYYYFLSGRYGDAEKQFIETGKLAAEKGNREGMFSSIMNLVNLYSMMIEEDLEPGRDWQGVTESAIKTIQEHRDSYRELALKQEMEDLEKKADTAKREVTAEEKEAVEQRVNQETAEVNYKLDIAVSTLKFYRAEILYSRIRPQVTEKEAAWKLYTDNRDIFNLYTGALAGFETALSVPGVSSNPELQCRLLINSAVCYERIGENEKAYVALLDARAIAVKYEFRWLRVAANYALGSFLARSGREVEKGDYAALADKYFSSAIETAEECPLLVVSHSNRTGQVYREYIDFLIASGRGERAFTLSEKYSRFRRIALVNSVSPAFKNSYDRKYYYDYIAALAVLSSLESDISAMLVRGLKPDSPEVKALRTKREEQQEHISYMYAFTLSANKLVASWLETGAVELPDPGYDVFRFHQTPKGIYYWKVSGGRITSGYAIGAGLEAIDKVTGSGSVPVFIIPEEDTVEMLVRGRLTRPYSLVSGIDRTMFYRSEDIPLTMNILSVVSGLNISDVDASVESWSDRVNPADYGIIVSKTGTNSLADPAALFGSGISPSCMVFAGVRSYSSMILSAEAALYNGTGRIIFTDDSAESVSAGLNMMLAKDKSGMNFNGLVYGYIKTMVPQASDVKKQAEAELAQFNKNLKLNRLSQARAHLSRWYALTGRASKTRYDISLWQINLFEGNYAAADEVNKQMDTSIPDVKTASLIMNIYRLLYTGRLAEAKQFLGKNRSEIGSKADMDFLDLLLGLAERGDKTAVSKAQAMVKNSGTVLPLERYIVLLLRYSILANPGTAIECAALVPQDSALSEREQLLLMLTADIRPGFGFSVRFDRIMTVTQYRHARTQLSDTVKGVISGDEGYDRLSVYSLLFALKYLMDDGFPDTAAELISSVDIITIAASSDPLDAMLLLKTCQQICAGNRKYDTALKYVTEMNKYSGDSPFIDEWIYARSAELLTLSGEYKAAYDSGLEAEKIMAEGGMRDSSLSLLMINILVITGQYDEAGGRIGLVTDISAFTPAESFIFGLQRTLVELNRLGRLKSATTADAALFEKLFGDTLESLEKDPSLAAGEGAALMVRIVFDEYINYRMRTGSYADAHLLNEMKKIIFASAYNNKNMVTMFSPLTIEKLQGMIPAEAVYVNVAKNRNDLFIWVIDARDKRTVIIPGGYSTAMKIISGYEADMAAGRDISQFGREIGTFLQPMLSLIKNKKNIIFCCDSSTEKIPFEIAGDGPMLCEGHGIVFIASPFLLNTSPALKADSVRMISFNEDSQADYLERAAIRESGITCIITQKPGSGIVHIAGDMRYSVTDKAFLDGIGRPLTVGAEGADLVYMTAGDLADASVTNLVFAASSVSGGEIVVNNAPVKDINRGVFINSFYAGLSKGDSPAGAFRAASDKLRNGRFRHPSNWMGIRIYMRSLQ